MSTKEIWRPVPSLAGLIASSMGRLMVVPYWAPLPNGGVRIYGGEPTSGQWDGKRFLYLMRGKTYKAHRLICEAFHGAPPTEKSVCMHIDENSANNAPGNLAWGSQKENLNATGFIEYCKARTGDSNPHRKGIKIRRVAGQPRATAQSGQCPKGSSDDDHQKEVRDSG